MFPLKRVRGAIAWCYCGESNAILWVAVGGAVYKFVQFVLLVD